jgi:hypothetical protein
MTLRTLDLARWRRAEAREMALRPPFRLNVHNRAKCDIGAKHGEHCASVLYSCEHTSAGGASVQQQNDMESLY